MSEISTEGQDLLRFVKVEGVHNILEVLKEFKDKDVYNEKVASEIVGIMDKEIQEMKNNNMQIMNVSKTMQNLTQVGDLLQVANKLSTGFHCNEAIIKILYKYQILLRNCLDALTIFKSSTRSALKSHQEAVGWIEDNELEEALNLLEECVKNANELAEKAKGLAKQSEELTVESGEALTKATEQDVANNDKKLQLTLQRQTMDADKAKRVVLQAQLEKEVAEYREKLDIASAKAESEGNKAFVLAIIGMAANTAMLMNPATAPMAAMNQTNKNDDDGKSAPDAVDAKKEEKMEEEQTKNKIELDKVGEEIKEKNEEMKEKVKEKDQEEIKRLEDELKELKDKEEKLKEVLRGLEKGIDRLYDMATLNAANAETNAARIREILFEKRKDEIESKGELAKLACEIRNSDINLKDINSAIQMIKLTMLTLGKVSTSLNNTALFWKNQAQQCTALAVLGQKGTKNLEGYKKTHKERFLKNAIGALNSSGMTWLTLYAINSEAVVAIRPAKEKIDEVMSALKSLAPQKSEEIIAAANEVLFQIEVSNSVDHKAIENTN